MGHVLLLREEEGRLHEGYEKADMESVIKRLDGANLDIDLVTPDGQIAWQQDPYPWNAAEDTSQHRCAVKDISICPYFCGVEYLDNVMCCYPHDNPHRQQG